MTLSTSAAHGRPRQRGPHPSGHRSKWRATARVSVFGDGNGWIPAILRADEAGHEDVRVFFVSLLCDCGKPKHQGSTGIRFQLIVGEGVLDEGPDFRRVDPDSGQQPPLPRVGGQTLCTGSGDEREKDDAGKQPPKSLVRVNKLENLLLWVREGPGCRWRWPGSPPRLIRERCRYFRKGRNPAGAKWQAVKAGLRESERGSPK